LPLARAAAAAVLKRCLRTAEFRIVMRSDLHGTPETAWRATAATPLLHELVRALRARRHCERAAPELIQILARTSAVWSAALLRSPQLGLTIGAQGWFALPSGEKVGGIAIAQLAGELAGAGIQQLQFQPGLRAEEMVRFVEILAAATACGPLQLDYAQLLERAEIEHIALGYSSEESEPAKPEPTATAARRSPAAAGGDPVAACLADLARSHDVVAFQRALERLRNLLDAQMASGNYADAYGVALALGRHASSERLSTAMREAAAESLQALVLCDPELVRIPLECIYGPHSEAAIEAMQLLAVLGPRLVPRLLHAHESGTPASQQYTTSILLAMGDSVFPALMEQLESGELGRAVLTAGLLGEMQNPRALSALSAALSHRRPVPLRLAAACAVARIGGERARVVLEAHGLSLEDEVSSVCRSALRDWQSARQGGQA
jgi:hypothetical protein